MIDSVLIIGFVWPEPNSSAAGGRMLQLIALFKEQGWEVTFASAAQDSEYMYDLGAFGINRQKITLNDSSFDSFIKELHPSMVLFDRFMIEEQFGWRVAEQCPDALRVLDTEDLHCLRHARQLAFKQGRAFERSDLFSDLAKREIASILRSDISLMISEYEMELLEQVFKVDKALLYYLPFLLEPIANDTIESWTSFDDSKDFVFIGNFLHEPNWNAVQYLKETLWKLIREQLPDALLRVYGAYPSQKVLQLHNPKEGFFIMGRAVDAGQVVKSARVVLAPLRFGAGIKGKLIEAMLYGRPSVTTSIGAESIAIHNQWNGFVEDDAQAFADSAVRLYVKKPLWESSQQAGIMIFNSRYLKNMHAPDFIRHLYRTKDGLAIHREGNFIGSMLLHHLLKSTKYMSKWIEEKNKI